MFEGHLDIFRLVYHDGSYNTSTGKCYTKGLIKGLADLHWIFCAGLVFVKILLLCQKLQCLACLPKLCSYKENAILCFQNNMDVHVDFQIPEVFVI